MRRVRMIAVWVAVILVAAVTVWALWPRDHHSADSATVTSTVQYVVDGDTIIVAPVPGVLEANNKSGDGHFVRLLGIDAPEARPSGGGAAECGALDSTAHLRGLLPVGSVVTLTFDARSDHTDRFDRSLAYVSTDAVADLNAEQVAGGWAEAWHPKSSVEPERFATYRAAQADAQRTGAGAWATCTSLGR